MKKACEDIPIWKSPRNNGGTAAIPFSGNDDRSTTKRDARLSWLLRVLGGFDLLALAAVVVPQIWIAATHNRLGLGVFPTEPIVIYLARSASALYAMHGALLIFVSFDVRRYDPLIRFLAIVAIVHGAAILAIDAAAGMPFYWTLLEGPCFAATGVAVLVLRRSACRRSA